jgi:KaiC/GvpD/RAD55 family RecA-like ATPase
MSISIKKNIKPTFENVEMLCDKPLSKSLSKYDLTNFLNCHSTNLLIGKPGSGKTTLMISLFNKLLRGCFHNIFLFQLSHSRASMKKDIFEELPDEQKFDELNYDNLLLVLDAIKSEPEYNHCIIFDDMGAYLKDNAIRKLLKEIIFNRRHYHISIYFLCQSYLSFEKTIRKLLSNIFVFRVSKNELETIFNEVVESKKDYIYDLAKLVFDSPHKHLFINTD